METFCSHCMGVKVVQKKPQKIQRQMHSLECKYKTKPKCSGNINSGKISLGRIYGRKSQKREMGSCGVASGLLCKDYLVKRQHQVILLCRVMCTLDHDEFLFLFFFHLQTTSFYLSQAIFSE